MHCYVLNKMYPASSADIEKSNTATRVVLGTIVRVSAPRFIRHRHCNGPPVKAACECPFALPDRFCPEPTVENLLGMPHPLVAFTQASERRQETSPAPSMLRITAAKASCALRLMETSSSSNSRLGAEALGQTRSQKAERGGSAAHAGCPRREFQFISAGCWFQLGPTGRCPINYGEYSRALCTL